MIYKHNGVTKQIHQKDFTDLIYRLVNVNVVTVDDEDLEEIGDNEYLVRWKERRKCIAYFSVYADEKAFENRVVPLETIQIEFDYTSGTDLVTQAYLAIASHKDLGGGELI